MSHVNPENSSDSSKENTLFFISQLPPPPPPMLPQEFVSEDKSSSRKYIPYNSKEEIYSLVYNDILRKCDILNIVCSKNKIWMHPVNPFLQVGPTCGLATICMWGNSIDRPLKLEDLLSISQANGYTKQGEMFSVENFKALCDQVFGPNLIEVHHGMHGLERDKTFIINEIKSGAIGFVPYDADYNHDPCLRNGLKAHWALIFGILEPDNHENEESYFLARQGKSNYIGVWKFSELSASNANLREVDPERRNGEYVIPSGGIEMGLCNQYLLLRQV